MYRFLLRPAWLVFHLVVASAIVLMVNLGFWQLDRLDERQRFNQTVIERTERDPLDVADFLAPGAYDPDRDEWTPVRLTGTYLPDQVVEFNQSQGGRAGDNVLTGLVLDELDVTVIVNRGFVPLPTPAPTPPETRVEIVGVIRASESRERGGLTDPEQDVVTEVRRIEIPVLAAQFGGDVAPFYVQLFASDPPAVVGDPEPVLRPELSDGPHLSYAVQWFVFALCVAIGWVLAVRRSLSTRRRSERPAPVTELAAPPEPVDAGHR
ncbi:MAG: SURF1 family protein [Actinomycetota bacterium]